MTPNQVKQRIQETENIINELRCVLSVIDIDTDIVRTIGNLQKRIGRIVNIDAFALPGF